VGKAGSEVSAVSEGIGRLISLILRMRPDLSQTEKLAKIAAELKGIGGSRSNGFGPHRVTCLVDGIGQILQDHLTGENQKTFIDFSAATDDLVSQQPHGIGGDICPECGEASFLAIEGCRKCIGCGYSEC
jgi:ribonucleoside-diphosphate reductase alpha chain